MSFLDRRVSILKKCLERLQDASINYVNFDKRINAMLDVKELFSQLWVIRSELEPSFVRVFNAVQLVLICGKIELLNLKEIDSIREIVQMMLETSDFDAAFSQKMTQFLMNRGINAFQAIE